MNNVFNRGDVDAIRDFVDSTIYYLRDKEEIFKDKTNERVHDYINQFNYLFDAR
jgi:hypothetical protein